MATIGFQALLNVTSRQVHLSYLQAQISTLRRNRCGRFPATRASSTSWPARSTKRLAVTMKISRSLELVGRSKSQKMNWSWRRDWRNWRGMSLWRRASSTDQSLVWRLRPVMIINSLFSRIYLWMRKLLLIQVKSLLIRWAQLRHG